MGNLDVGDEVEGLLSLAGVPPFKALFSLRDHTSEGWGGFWE